MSTSTAMREKKITELLNLNVSLVAFICMRKKIIFVSRESCSSVGEGGILAGPGQMLGEYFSNFLQSNNSQFLEIRKLLL